MQRFVGTVGGERGALVFADATLAVGKKKHVERREGPGTFALVLDDGRTIQVEGVVSATRRGKVELEGRYGELASHPIARLFDARAPGDHVRAQIRGFALFGGDPVTVVGEVIEERVVATDAPSGAGSLREAPAREAAKVRADTLVLGRHTEEERTPTEDRDASGASGSAPRRERERPRSEPRARVHLPLERSSRVALGVGGLLFVGGLVLSWIAPLVPLRAWLTPMVGLGLALLLLGARRARRGRFHASYVTIVGGARLTRSAPIEGYGVDPWLVAFGYAAWVWMPAIEPSPSAVTICLAVPAILAAIHLALLAHQEAPFRRFAALVLSMPVYREGQALDARTTLVEGRVTSEGTVVRRRVEFIPKTEVSYRTDSSGHTHEETSTIVRDREHTSAEPFTIEVPGLGLAEVQPREAAIALAHRVWRAHPSHAVYEELLSHGDPVCVVSRWQTHDAAHEAAHEATRGAAALAAARGDESLFVFAGSRRELVSALARARLALVLQALVVLTPIALGLYAFPFAARFHASGRVVATSGELPYDTRCEARVLAYHYGQEPRCSLRLSCDGAQWYGGFGMGQMDCRFEGSPFEATARGEDASAFDGDAAVSFSLPEGTLVWSDEQGRTFTLALEPASWSPIW